MSAPSSRAELFLGLISGTSADGIDAALVRFHGDDPHARPELLCGRTFPWDSELRVRLVALGQQAQALTLDEVGELDLRIARAFADAANALIAAAGIPRHAIAAIGSHGQTLRHRPQGPLPFTLQLGDPSTVAERCGLPVVADFRRRVGQGAHDAVRSGAGKQRFHRDAGHDGYDQPVPGVDGDGRKLFRPHRDDHHLRAPHQFLVVGCPDDLRPVGEGAGSAGAAGQRQPGRLDQPRVEERVADRPAEPAVAADDADGAKRRHDGTPLLGRDAAKPCRAWKRSISRGCGARPVKIST